MPFVTTVSSSGTDLLIWQCDGRSVRRYSDQSVLRTLRDCYAWARDVWDIRKAIGDDEALPSVFADLKHAVRVMRAARRGEAPRDHVVIALAGILPYADAQVESLHYQWRGTNDEQAIAAMRAARELIASAYEITGLRNDG